MAGPTLPAELLSSTLFLLKRLGGSARQQAVHAFEQTGLNPSQYAVLSVLDEGSPETQAAIALALNYDRSQLVGLLDELEQRALLERRRDPNDRRRHVVRLTDEGRRTLDTLRSLVRQFEDEFLASLDEGKRATLHTLLLELAERHEPGCAQARAARER